MNGREEREREESRQREVEEGEDTRCMLYHSMIFIERRFGCCFGKPKTRRARAFQEASASPGHSSDSMHHSVFKAFSLP